MTAPVYIRASGSDELETCLLGTNVIFPLGLVQPAASVCHKEDGHASTRSVCLVQAKRVPARMGTYFDAQVECKLDQETPLLFEPDRCWTEKVGLEVDDMILAVNPDDSLNIPILNRGNETLQAPEGVSIGSVRVLSDSEVSDPAPPDDSTVSPSVAVVHTTSSSSERLEWLTSMLKISESLAPAESKKLLECVLQHHEVFAIEDNE